MHLIQSVGAWQENSPGAQLLNEITMCDITYEIDFEFHTLKVELPYRLYHYTSDSGLMGIVSTKTIWSTASGYLNDPQEYKYGRSLIDSFLAQTIDDTYKGGFAASCLHHLRVFSGLYVFVTALSEECDLLSQWRGYTRVGKGFCICFDAANILKRCKEEGGWEMAPCIYDEEMQMKMIERAFTFYLQRAKKDESEKIQRKPSKVSEGTFTIKRMVAPSLKFAYMAVILASIFKHPEFAEEKEWRIVRRLGVVDAPIIKHRSGAHSLIPYIEFPVEPPEQMIREVIVGPTSEVELSKDATQLFLRRSSLPEVSIVSSSIPFREM